MGNKLYLGLTKVSHPQYRGFDEFLDDVGNVVYRDKKTGNWVECVQYDAPRGSKVITPRQLEAQAAYRERGKEIEEAKAAEQRNRGYNKWSSFYFALSRDRRSDGIKPQTLARVFFLATFLRYDDNRLFSQDGKPLTKKDAAELLRLGSSAFKSFWNEVIGKYLFLKEDGSITIIEEFFRGSLAGRGNQEDAENGYQQLFIKSLRELYWQIEPKKHRYLGYLFAILGQINWEYNILCWNPSETDRSKIETMDLDDFCRSMGDGYTANQRQRLLDAFRKLTFSVDNTTQYLCAYLEDHVARRFYLVVNPNVVYRGTDRTKVDGFGVLFPNLLDIIRPANSG